MGHSREAHKMLTCSTVPRLTHLLTSVPKDEASAEWMASVDEAHLSTWLRCVGASSLDETLPRNEREHLAATLDLPPLFGGIGLQSLVWAADEEMLGSWASITAELISFCISKGMDV